jgi:hypothetical protein
MSSGRMSGL